MKYPPEELQKRFKQLPEQLKEVMFAETTADIVVGIAKKHSLNIEKTGKLADEIGYVMFGVSHPKDFIRNLAEALEVDNEKAREIAGDVNESIFQPVREHIKKLYGMADTTPEITLPPSPKPQQQTKQSSPPALPVPPKPIQQEKEGFVFREKLHEVQREKPETIDVELPSERKSSFEDLKRELRKAIEREHSTQKTRQPAPYKDIDPYREPFG